MNTGIKQLTVNYAHTNEKEKKLKRILPFLLLVSFIWLNLYEAISGIDQIRQNFSESSLFGVNLFISFLFSGGIAYISFEIAFWVYRFLLGFSIYTFIVPKEVFQNRFRLWFILRNILLGFIFNLCFIFPFITLYLAMFEILFNFLFIICFYFSIARKYVDPLIRHFLFRIIALWMIIYEAVEILILVVRVLR